MRPPPALRASSRWCRPATPLDLDVVHEVAHQGEPAAGARDGGSRQLPKSRTTISIRRRRGRRGHLEDGVARPDRRGRRHSRRPRRRRRSARRPRRRRRRPPAASGQRRGAPPRATRDRPGGSSSRRPARHRGRAARRAPRRRRAGARRRERRSTSSSQSASGSGGSGPGDRRAARPSPSSRRSSRRSTRPSVYEERCVVPGSTTTTLSSYAGVLPRSERAAPGAPRRNAGAARRPMMSGGGCAALANRIVPALGSTTRVEHRRHGRALVLEREAGRPLEHERRTQPSSANARRRSGARHPARGVDAVADHVADRDPRLPVAQCDHVVPVAARPGCSSPAAR